MIQLGLSYQKIFGWFPNTNNSFYVLEFISKFYIISSGKYFASILEISKTITWKSMRCSLSPEQVCWLLLCPKCKMQPHGPHIHSSKRMLTSTEIALWSGSACSPHELWTPRGRVVTVQPRLCKILGRITQSILGSCWEVKAIKTITTGQWDDSAWCCQVCAGTYVCAHPHRQSINHSLTQSM